MCDVICVLTLNKYIFIPLDNQAFTVLELRVVASSVFYQGLCAIM